MVSTTTFILVLLLGLTAITCFHLYMKCSSLAFENIELAQRLHVCRNALDACNQINSALRAELAEMQISQRNAAAGIVGIAAAIGKAPKVIPSTNSGDAAAESTT